MIYLILAGLIIAAAEIIYDNIKYFSGKSDKPESTIMRAVLLAATSIVAVSLQYPILGAVLIPFASHLFFFDQSLNITRWKVLSKMNLTYDHRIAHGLPTTKLQRMWYKTRVFLDKLYYHSGEGTDRIYSRIPWFFETFLKLIILYTAIILSL